MTPVLARGERGAPEAIFDTPRAPETRRFLDYVVEPDTAKQQRYMADFGKGILDWAGLTEDEMRGLWRRLFAESTGATLFPESWKLVDAHQRKGHTVVIASSATLYQIEPLAEKGSKTAQTALYAIGRRTSSQ